MASNSATNVPLLTTANYSLWEPAMQDYLRAKGHWFWIHNPVPPTTDPKNRLKCMMSAPSGSTCTYSLQDADKELLIAVLLHGTKYTALTTCLLSQSSRFSRLRMLSKTKRCIV